MAEKQNFFQRLRRKAATYYVTVVSPSNHNFSDIMRGSSLLSMDNLVANFETIPQLFAVTDYIASTVSNIPVKVVKPSGKPATNSELWKLIESPNKFQSWRELIKLHFSYYEPLGNAYLYSLRAEGLPGVSSLYCLPAEKVQVVLLMEKSLPHWMNEVAGYIVRIGGKDYTLKPEQVLHEKYVTLRYDDGSWTYGMSKYVPGDKISRELKAIHDAKTSIIEQRGALGFITNESEQPDPEQSKAVKEKLSENYGLLGEQAKVIVTTERLRWQQMALGVQELQLIENAKYSFATLCQMNGIDPVIFSTEGSTFANKAEAVKDMMLKVIKPKVDAFYEALSTFLGYGDRIVADWSQVAEMQDDRKLMTDLLTRQIECMILTPKEAREKLYGDIEGDIEPPDEYFRKTSLVRVDEPTQPAPAELTDEQRQQAEDERRQEDGR